MRYYEEMKLKRLKSIDRSLKEISYVLRVFVESALGDEPEVPKKEEPTVVSNAVGFEVTRDADGE